jgi:hypothetical protein
LPCGGGGGGAPALSPGGGGGLSCADAVPANVSVVAAAIAVHAAMRVALRIQLGERFIV